MDTPRTWYIYGLIDPNTSEVRYIGWTYDADKRLKSHIHSAKRTKSHKSHWIQSLLSANRKPELVIFETGTADWIEAERRWIADYRAKGARLTNATDGGEGTPGFYPNAETRKRMSISHTGRKQTPESTAKTRAALLGRKQSLEHIAALAATRKGKIPVHAMLAASIANKGRKQTLEHIVKRFQSPRKRPDIRRLSDAQVRHARSTAGVISLRKIAKEFGVGQTLIHEIRHRLAYQDVLD